MTNILYTEEQILLLRENPYVKNCSQRHCVYTDQCKIEALKLDEQWWYFRDIFRYLGFPDFYVTSKAPKQIIKNWRHALRTRWLSNMLQSRRGRKTEGSQWRKKEEKDISLMNKDEYIAYLETKTAYLEEIQRMIHWHDP